MPGSMDFRRSLCLPNGKFARCGQLLDGGAYAHILRRFSRF